jgi:hypothetical protein
MIKPYDNSVFLNPERTEAKAIRNLASARNFQVVERFKTRRAKRGGVRFTKQK